VADWDLPEFHATASSYIFPHYICATPLKVDGFIVSKSKKLCIILEFTSPIEDNLDLWNVKKKAKYLELVDEAIKNGWQIRSVFIEVGARGWVPRRVFTGLRSLGLDALDARTLCKRLSFIALKSSYVIWINRFNKDFKPWRLNDQEQSVRGAAGVAKPDDLCLERKVPVDGKFLREGKRSDNVAAVSGGSADVQSPISYAELMNLLKDTENFTEQPLSPAASEPLGSPDLQVQRLEFERDEIFKKIMDKLSQPLS